jgi:serine/threonine protein kinase
MGWSELIGQRLGDDEEYEIVAELGRGGSSRVYQARDHAHERDVAIKVIPSDADDKAGFIKRFEREAQAVETLHHPNIVEVYGKGETEELVYLVMQCVTGGTFRSRMGGRMAVAEAAGAAIQMAHALHHAHQQGIIHRDVKPSNMLVDAENSRRLLLTDFGIAKLLGMRGLTKSGTTIGTPEYMSPEQAEGREVDHRADVYSLGCVLYEALTGRPPFTGPTPVSVLYQQVHARPPYVRGLNSQAPHELMQVVQRALSKHPDGRFQTAEAFAQALYPFTERSSATYPVASWPPAERAIATDDGAAVIEPGTGEGTGERPSGERAASERGLGAEGLDAIFPDDPEAREARKSELAQHPTQPPAWDTADRIPISQRSTEPPASPDAEHLPITERPTLQPFAVPISDRNTQPPTQRRKRSSIPVSPLRLPSKPTQPLDLPVGPDGRLDIEAMMAEAERQAGQPSAEERTAPPSGPARQPIILYTDVDSALGPGPVGTSEAEMAGALRRYDWDDAGGGGWRPRRAGGGGWPPPRAGIALLVVVLLAVLLGVGINTSALGLIRSTARAQATVTTAPATQAPAATSTSTSIGTSTPSSRPTATTNPQSKLDAAAAASFSAIILSAFPDQSCSQANNTTHFAQRTVYVDLCTSSKLLPNPVSIAVRQNGAVIYPVANNVYLSYPGHYYFGRYAVAPGSYDMWVTMTVQGKTATARDIPFTVA